MKLENFNVYSNQELIKFVKKDPQNTDAINELRIRFDRLLKFGIQGDLENAQELCIGFLEVVGGTDTFKILLGLGLFKILDIDWFDQFYDALSGESADSTLAQIYVEYMIPNSITDVDGLLWRLTTLNLSYEDVLKIGYAMAELNRSIDTDILGKFINKRESATINEIKKTSVCDKLSNWFSLCERYKKFLYKTNHSEDMRIWR